MKKISNSFLNEEYFITTLDNGLKVCLLPKLKYHRVYALFSTNFGSCDVEFKPLGFDEYIKVPLGIAHFLEHKNFEYADGTDATEVFAETGADCNAFTTYDKTVYLFSSCSEVEKNLNTLLDFVQTPYFTKESVDREQGIIEQELKMYLDRPYTVLYNALLENMYKVNHVRNDIGGTLESIKEINSELLQLCHDTFYHPSNMCIVLVGNFDVDNIYNVIKENQKNKSYNLRPAITRKYYLEDNTVLNKDTKSYMDINKPKVGCGVKFSVLGCDNKTIYKKMVLLDIITSMFFDESSSFYNKLLKEGIIDNSFSYDVYFESTFAHILFMVNTDKVEEFKVFLKAELLSISSSIIESNVFKRYKNVEIANAIAKFNSIEAVASQLVDISSLGLDLFETVDIKNNLVIEDLNEVKKEFIERAITFHTIYPKNS